VHANNALASILASIHGCGPCARVPLAGRLREVGADPPGCEGHPCCGGMQPCVVRCSADVRAVDGVGEHAVARHRVRNSPAGGAAARAARVLPAAGGGSARAYAATAGPGFGRPARAARPHAKRSHDLLSGARGARRSEKRLRRYGLQTTRRHHLRQFGRSRRHLGGRYVPAGRGQGLDQLLRDPEERWARRCPHPDYRASLVEWHCTGH